MIVVPQSISHVLTWVVNPALSFAVVRFCPSLGAQTRSQPGCGMVTKESLWPIGKVKIVHLFKAPLGVKLPA